MLQGFGYEQTKPTTVWEDNAACIAITNNQRAYSSQVSWHPKRGRRSHREPLQPIFPPPLPFPAGPRHAAGVQGKLLHPLNQDARGCGSRRCMNN
eukprot:2907737-Rhodomonas_salina.1